MSKILTKILKEFLILFKKAPTETDYHPSVTQGFTYEVFYFDLGKHQIWRKSLANNSEPEQCICNTWLKDLAFGDYQWVKIHGAKYDYEQYSDLPLSIKKEINQANLNDSIILSSSTFISN